MEIKNQMDKAQKGASLTEFMLYSVVALAVLIGAVMMYASSKSSSNVTTTQRELSGIRTGLNSLRGVQPDYSTITMSQLSSYKSIPSNLTVSGSTATSQTGVTYALGTMTTTADIQVTMPYDICTKVLTAMDSSWTTVGTLTPPISTTNAAAKCGTSGSTTIDFVFSN